ncbi:hypothetical protein HEP81_07399 [Streptomyces griseofuscus]|uniref:Uncharacterized protein n=1 Tax=Streptomyces griseofuscus TaxID=146922 RepID=A0A7H1QBF1_9ACTN|nr:hypothetical protein [Streptomyces murinus]QNT97631.1 hypothetical protein HEP81_07399 [Streptomyces griseofuscus]BBC98240.1 hypothetical protein SRO_7064 [Streptomyces rochei]
MVGIANKAGGPFVRILGRHAEGPYRGPMVPWQGLRFRAFMEVAAVLRRREEMGR